MMIAKEIMIANLRKQRDMLSQLILDLVQKEELEKGTRLLYDQVTKRVEQNLKEIKKVVKDSNN